MTGRVFNVVEKLAKKGNGKVANTFGDAASKLQGLVATEKDGRAMLENGGDARVLSVHIQFVHALLSRPFSSCVSCLTITV